MKGSWTLSSSAEDATVNAPNQWWVPLVEFTAGGAVLIGLLAPLAALGLLVIILVAIATSGRQRIELYKPIDESDRIDDWLYLPETLYAFMLIIVVSVGAGPYSLDALILLPQIPVFLAV